MLTRARRTGYRSQRVRVTHLKNNQARFTDQRHDRNKAHTAPTWSTTLQQEHTALFANKNCKTRSTALQGAHGPVPGVPHSNKSTQLCLQTNLQNKEHRAPRSSRPLPGVPHSNQSNQLCFQGAPRSDQSTRLFPTQRRLGLQIAFYIRTMSTSSQPSSTRRVRARQKNFLAFCGIGMPNFPPWRAQSLPWGAGSPKLIQAKIHSCVEVGSSYIDHENTAGHGQGGWFSSRRSIYVLQIRCTKL